MIDKLHIENFKSIREIDIDFNSDVNIIVGDNETGKSTILEAISMALTSQIQGRYIGSELSPYLFNKYIVEEYIEEIRAGKTVDPPQILIEIYLTDDEEYSELKGTNNSSRRDTNGVYLSIEFDDSYSDLYRIKSVYLCKKGLVFI